MGGLATMVLEERKKICVKYEMMGQRKGRRIADNGIELQEPKSLIVDKNGRAGNIPSM